MGILGNHVWNFEISSILRFVQPQLRAGSKASNFVCSGRAAPTRMAAMPVARWDPLVRGQTLCVFEGRCFILFKKKEARNWPFQDSRSNFRVTSTWQSIFHISDSGEEYSFLGP
jgi:hypothetical protein